jgi:Lipocalin-like domain
VSLQVIASTGNIASDDRLKTTPAEDKAIAHGTLDYFATYTVSESDKTLSIHIEASTFPNQITGSESKRAATVKGDELTIESERRMGRGKTVAKWQRVP